MTTAQIIILIIMGLGVLIGYIKTMLSKNDIEKFLWGILQLFFTSLFILITIIMTLSYEELLKEKNKCPEYEKIECPEYEKIENVYILKK